MSYFFQRLFILLSSFALALVLTACQSYQGQMPSISNATETPRSPGKIVWHDLLTDKPEETQAFYSTLLGWRFEAVDISIGSHKMPYKLIYNKDRLIGGMIDQRTLRAKVDISQWVTLMSVDDIEASVAAVQKNGGQLFGKVADLGERGHLAVIQDSQGAISALLQTRYGDPRDTAFPAVGDFLWNELWTKDLTAAQSFYQNLTDFSVEAIEQEKSYFSFSSQDHARFGLMEVPLPSLDPVWVSYIRVKDENSLHGLLKQVEALGGEILVNAQPRSIGGHVALIRDPSGAGIALQTWPKANLAEKGE
ncbi:VOC family protein [Agaribacterium sp. ZY112]|uniref:VOC family protein n=1 Tax=Agaribacterium sp. ZY112 TaxID=3233574 RepID=UPI003525E751